MKMPEHAESYNPPAEYILDPQEEAEWRYLDPEDRPRNYFPRKFPNLRAVPGYDRFINERFARCLDLYLCPRAMKKRVVDPDSLLPELPDPKDLEPYPKQLAVVYRGHVGHVRSLSTDPSGQWLATGGDDKTVRVWEVATGRCVATWTFKEVVTSVVWNPNKELALLAIARYPCV
jgi:ribosome biogenesis protein ERB1